MHLVLPDGTFSVLELESRDIPLGNLIERAFSRRKGSKKSGDRSKFEHTYNIEKKDEPGESLDKESLLSSYDTDEFYIVREHSKRKVDVTDYPDVRLKHQVNRSLMF